MTVSTEGFSENCSLPVVSGDYMHCALNNFDYDGSNACGACIEVIGAKGSVILKVVDRCPECASGDVDMTEQAFDMIADVIDGRVPISWKFVPCETISNDDSTPPECIQTLSTGDLLAPTTVFYPNPTSGLLYLQNDARKWTLNDAHGKMIDQGTASSIQMVALAPGVYFIPIENRVTKKIIKQ